MKVFVTGGTGVVGGSLVPRLLAKGWDVTVLTRDPKRNGLPRHERLQYFTGDLASRETEIHLFETKQRFDVIFHMAASLDYFAPKEAIFATNTSGTAIMANFARHSKASRFVYASSIEAAGAFTDNQIPASAGTNGRLISTYGASKRAAEEVALALPSEGVPTICVRIGNVYGAGWYNVIVEFAANLLNRGVLWEYLPLFGHYYLSPVHNDDVTEGLIAAAECSHSGIVNLVGNAATIEELFRFCAITMSVPFSCGQRKILDWLYVKYQTRYFPWRYKVTTCDTLRYITAPTWPFIHRAFSMHDTAMRLEWNPRWHLLPGINETLKWAKNSGLLSF